jgi:hypothetical protein
MNKPTKKPMKKRSKKREQIIVLVDGDENYYAFPRAALERSRVSGRRKKEVVAAIVDVPTEYWWIKRADVPGSTSAGPLKGGRRLHYAGYYLSSTKSKD